MLRDPVVARVEVAWRAAGADVTVRAVVCWLLLTATVPLLVLRACGLARLKSAFVS